jgi:hypothetical protein
MKRAIALVTALSLMACAKTFPPTPMKLEVREPTPDSVESVIFLIGDAGKASLESSPLLTRLRNEVEQWSSTVRDSAVMVLYLGDNVYPVGMRDETDIAFAQDSIHLQAQLDVVAGDVARRKGTRAVFIAGNHDWGHMPGEKGRDRLWNQQRFIIRRSRAQKIFGDFQPQAGDPGPGVLNVGRTLRVLLIDTAWWLLEANPEEKNRFMAKFEREFVQRGNHELVVVSHHPWQSGSAHGGLVPFWQGIGVKWLLSRSGASLQDLNSLPYRDLKTRMGQVFEKTAPPLVLAGGHDHNLQVIKATSPHEPRFSLVSGAGSKSSKVASTDGSLFHRSEPGFMRLVAMRSGAIDLFVVSAPGEFLDCAVSGAAQLEQCMTAGVQAFRTVYSTRLK